MQQPPAPQPMHGFDPAQLGNEWWQPRKLVLKWGGAALGIIGITNAGLLVFAGVQIYDYVGNSFGFHVGTWEERLTKSNYNGERLTRTINELHDQQEAERAARLKELTTPPKRAADHFHPIVLAPDGAPFVPMTDAEFAEVTNAHNTEMVRRLTIGVVADFDGLIAKLYGDVALPARLSAGTIYVPTLYIPSDYQAVYSIVDTKKRGGIVVTIQDGPFAGQHGLIPDREFVKSEFER